MKPRQPNKGAGQGSRGHLRLLSGRIVPVEMGGLPSATADSRSQDAHDDEASAHATFTPEPEWATSVSEAGITEGGITEAADALPPVAAEHIPVSVRMATLTLLPDAQLVSLALGAEARAFEILYRRHVAFAIHLATRIEGSSRDVEDIVHDAFIKAFSRLRDLSEPAAFRSWLGSIVVFAVRSRLRRTRLMNLLGLGRGSEPVDLDSLASPDASPHTRAQLAQVYALLRTRPTDERIAWTLRCVEGHELEVVARLTTCSLATVKRRISRTQSFLDEHFVTEASEGSPGSREAPGRSSEGRAPERRVEGRLEKKNGSNETLEALAAFRDSNPTVTPREVPPLASQPSQPSHRKSRP